MEDIQIEQLDMLAFSKGVLDKGEDYQDMEDIQIEQLGMLAVRNTQFVVVDIQLELEQVLDKGEEDHQDMEELLLSMLAVRNTQ